MTNLHPQMILAAAFLIFQDATTAELYRAGAFEVSRLRVRTDVMYWLREGRDLSVEDRIAARKAAIEAYHAKREDLTACVQRLIDDAGLDFTLDPTEVEALEMRYLREEYNIRQREANLARAA